MANRTPHNRSDFCVFFFIFGRRCMHQHQLTDSGCCPLADWLTSIAILGRHLLPGSPEFRSFFIYLFFFNMFFFITEVFFFVLEFPPFLFAFLFMTLSLYNSLSLSFFLFLQIFCYFLFSPSFSSSTLGYSNLSTTFAFQMQSLLLNIEKIDYSNHAPPDRCHCALARRWGVGGGKGV